ncbi:MAG: hypothetical protein ACOVMN_03260 [Flexibacteraceae bacterium]
MVQLNRVYLNLLFLFCLFLGNKKAYGQTSYTDIPIPKTAYFSKVIVPDSVLLTFNQRRAINKAISDSAYSKIAALLIQYSDEAGYPFAKVEPLVVKITEGYGLYFKVTRGPLFVWDTLTFASEIPIKGKFLEKYLYLKRSEIYNPKQAARAASVLRTMPYLQLQSDIVFGFSGKKVSPQLQVKYRKVNTADGVIGFLPNESQQGKLILNGEINLKLVNLFKSGKVLDLQWRSTRPGSLKLLAEYIHPVFLGTHWELQTNVQLLKEDSTFFNRALKAAFLYQFENGAKAGFYIRDNRSAVLLQNRETTTQNLSNLASTTYLELGSAIEINSLSDYFSPRKGIYLKSEFGLGQKQINNSSPDSTSQTTTSAPKTPQALLKVLQSSYIPTSSKSSLLVKFQLGALWNRTLQRNELLRLGGMQTMRGFAENLFFASKYAVATTEWFYYLDESSSISLFAEQAMMQRFLLTRETTDYPTAIGLGLRFGTRNGIFNLAYAFGRNNESPFSVRTAVVHFGISGRF